MPSLTISTLSALAMATLALGCSNDTTSEPAPIDELAESSVPVPTTDAAIAEVPAPLPPPPEATPPRPPRDTLLSVDSIEISRSTDRYGDLVVVKGVAEIHSDIGKRRTLATKLKCKQGNTLIADSGWLGSEAMFLPEKGRVPVEGKFFSRDALDDIPPTCEFEFYLWPRYEATGPIGWACYDGTSTRAGRCETPLASAQSSGDSIMEALEVKLDVVPATSKMRMRATIKHNKVLLGKNKILSRLSCQFGDKRVVDLHEHRLAVSVPLAAGESSLMGDVFFAKTWLGFEEQPSTCSLEISLATGAYAEISKDTLVYQGCYRDSELTKGLCSGFETALKDSATPTKNKIKIDRVRTRVKIVSVSGSKLNLEYFIDITALEKLEQRWTIVADTSCRSKAGKVSKAVKLGDVPLGRIAKGDTSRARGYFYEEAPADFLDGSESCDISFVASPLAIPGKNIETERASFVPIDKYCYRGGKTTRGACRGK